MTGTYVSLQNVVAVLLTCNVTLTNFACNKISADCRGMVPFLLTSIHCVSRRMNTGEQNKCYTHLISISSQANLRVRHCT